MGTVRWVGRQKTIAQVNTVTPANVNIGNLFNVTINSKVFTFTATDTLVATVVTGLAALLNANTDGDVTEMTFTDSTTHLTITANTPGVPFTQTSSASGGTATNTTATTTANKSPNDANDAVNWDTGVLPGAADDVKFDQGSVPVYWNLGALSAVALTSLERTTGYTGSIGLPIYNANGYREYRDTEFTIGATTWNFEQASSDAADSFKFNAGATNATLSVLGEGASALGSESLWWRGSGTNTVKIKDASLVIAQYGETAAVGTITGTNSTIRWGTVTTITTLDLTECTTEANATYTTLTMYGGSLTDTLAVAATTISIYDGGRLLHDSTGTITTLTVGPGSSFEQSTEKNATITNKVNLYSGSSLLDPGGNLTLSGGYQTVQCRTAEVTLDFGVNRSYTVA
jgi:hypothetical protein